MPIFDYKCPKCEHTEEVVELSPESSLPECATCKIEMTRQFPAPALSFVGSGWTTPGMYRTFGE